MKLPTELLLLCLAVLTPSNAAPLEPRGASFDSLRGLTSLESDHSASESLLRPDKWFQESTFDTHYDGRFAKTPLPHHVRTLHLRLLLKSYIETTERIGIKTWLMHGCLLGWWWNGRIMPWDNDIDFMVDEPSMQQLGNWWNMTVHPFTAQDLGLEHRAEDVRLGEGSNSTKYAKPGERALQQILRDGKKYLLEVNPNYKNKSTRDRYNVIDARWIDTSTGLYIDITTVHQVPEDSQEEPENDDLEMYTKDQHAYSYSQLFPLRSTTFESLPVKVPYAYESLLYEEYGPSALLDKSFKGYDFDPDKLEWIPAPNTVERAELWAHRAKYMRERALRLAAKMYGRRKPNRS